MGIDVKTFLNQEPPSKEGKLERWEADIFQLHHAGVSYQRITDYLELNGCHTTKADVYRFIHRKKRRHLLEPNPDPADAGQDVAQQPSANKVPAAPESKTGTDVAAKIRPKFNFQGSMEKAKRNY